MSIKHLICAQRADVRGRGGEGSVTARGARIPCLPQRCPRSPGRGGSSRAEGAPGTPGARGARAPAPAAGSVGGLPGGLGSRAAPAQTQEAQVRRQLAGRREHERGVLHKALQESSNFSRLAEEKLNHKMELSKEIREAHLAALRERLREKVRPAGGAGPWDRGPGAGGPGRPAAEAEAQGPAQRFPDAPGSAPFEAHRVVLAGQGQ